MLLKADLLLGLLGTLTILLISVSIVAIIRPKGDFFTNFLVFPFFLDGLRQFPLLVLTALSPSYPSVNASSPLYSYPISNTGVFPLLIQIPGALLVWFGAPFWRPLFLNWRIHLLVATMCVRISLRLFYLPSTSSSSSSSSSPSDDYGTMAFRVLLLSISYITLVFALTPTFLHQWISQALRYISTAITALLSSVYLFLTRVYPKLVSLIWSFLSLPLVVSVYKMFILPIWTLLTPFWMPSWLLAITVSTCMSVYERFASFPFLTVNAYVLTIGQMLCILTSTLSLLILFVHALSFTPLLSRSYILLEHTRMLACLYHLSRIGSFPLTLLRQVCIHIATFIDRHVFAFIRSIFVFAVELPFISIPIVLFVNGMIFYTLYISNSISASFGYLYGGVNSLLMYTNMNLHRIQESNLHQVLSADSTAIVVIVAIIQSAIYTTCESTLSSMYYYMISQENNRNASDTALSMSELQSLAFTMQNPRQCARCLYGPVDHRGCNNLSTHHGESTQNSGAYISNACPRCGWFVSDLSLWPPFNSHMAMNSSIFKQRVWGELVLSVRSGSKALLLPILLMQISSYVLPMWLASLMSLSYILPWLVENRNIFKAMHELQMFAVTSRRRRNNAARRRGTTEFENADCGHSDDNQNEIARILHEDDAMALVLSSVPVKIFLSEGVICPVCLDDYGDEAVKIVSASANVTESLSKLRSLSPACIPLRCGHPLHLPCVKAVVKAATTNGGATRHVRCPLCREPATLAGAASARFFN